MATFHIIPEQLQMLFLIFLRISAVMLTLPVFDSRSIPILFKAGFALAVSAPVAAAPQSGPPAA